VSKPVRPRRLTPLSLEDYQAAAVYKDLAALWRDKFGSLGFPSNIDLCDDEKKAQIEEYMKLSAEERNKNFRRGRKL
jgi:hypothetical protein